MHWEFGIKNRQNRPGWARIGMLGIGKILNVPISDYGAGPGIVKGRSSIINAF